MTHPSPLILDISEWQPPQTLHYAQLAKQIDHVIVRVQYGSAYEDKHYKTHIPQFQALGIPVAVYAWVRGTSIADMQDEARVFYERAKQFKPSFYWLDVEEFSMPDMRRGVEAYRQKLKELSNAKVGAYVANHLFRQLNLAIESFDGLWLPTYGANTGIYQGADPTASQAYDLHQYTSQGCLVGYSGPLDLSRLASNKSLSYFTEGTQKAPAPETSWGHAEKGIFTLNTAIHLRTAPDRTAASLAVLPSGAEVHYDAFAHQNGYVWIRQPRQDGSCAYLATGPTNGQTRTAPSWGSFR
ncbi:hypothetical protein NRIC_11990 [Enterococcus florum]|uniref:SH3b domain-containing protein n=1 Tax=Enterococcus florum TaxID=2480627 RepID=A0A4P5PBJ1_9ENTE|nr:GH25 family lysozyme [Enterococcus florum]GCF93308.1 hypothetical protein NRIC_11990 [Enterococcus florum]